MKKLLCVLTLLTACIPQPQPEPLKFTVSPSQATIAPGTSLQLVALRAGAGETLVASWDSSDSSVVTIDQSGLATANMPGAATITASLDGVTSSATINVTPAPVQTPTLTQAQPTLGNVFGGTTVTIDGTALSDVTFVVFGTSLATSLAVVSDTRITCVSPPGTGTVNIVVTTSRGTSNALPYRYIQTPTAISLTPTLGLVEGGATVTLTGEHFLDVTSVKFDGVDGTALSIVSDTTLMVQTPPSSAGTKDVVLIAADTQSNALPFTYGHAPVVTDVAPPFGPIAGGTTITITGTHFTDAAAVTFAGNQAASFTIDSATQITAVTPPAAAGSGDVRVTTPFATSAAELAARFTFKLPPTLTLVSPNRGPLSGTTVTLTGTELDSATSVSFGAAPATSFTVDSATQITAQAPPGSNSVDVAVTTPYGVSNTLPFAYHEAPTLSLASPSSGVITGGDVVTLTGSKLNFVSSVTFGGQAGTSLTVLSETALTVVTPPHAVGLADIVVTTAGGVSNALSFDYGQAPTVTGLSLAAGPNAGGTVLTITGTHFTGAAAVTFGADPASFVVLSDTQIQATTPAADEGTVAVRVTTPYATSAVAAAGQYTFEHILVVTGVSPNRGAYPMVTIYGSAFLGASAVHFGSQLASGFVVASDSRITVTAPFASLPQNVHVTVTTPEGTSPTSAVSEYAYVRATVELVTPNAGTTAGGTTLTLKGAGFTSASAAMSGDNGIFGFSVQSDSQMTATTQARSAGVVQINDVLRDALGNPAGAPASTGDAFTFQSGQARWVSGISPASGPVGTEVTITGGGFLSAVDCLFGSISSSCAIDSDTQIRAVVPVQAAGAYHVIITGVDNNSPPSPASVFTYVP